MEPTLVKGDVLAFDTARSLCGMTVPKRGDVVVFRRSGLPFRYLQRVVAGPGDAIGFQGATPMVNGQAVSERPVAQPAPQSSGEGGYSLVRETLSNGASYLVQHFPQYSTGPYPSFKLGPDQWFVLGDNRDDAIDSRRYGPIETSAICGVAYKFIRAHDPKLVGTKP